MDLKNHAPSDPHIEKVKHIQAYLRAFQTRQMHSQYCYPEYRLVYEGQHHRGRLIFHCSLLEMRNRYLLQAQCLNSYGQQKV